MCRGRDRLRPEERQLAKVGLGGNGRRKRDCPLDLPWAHELIEDGRHALIVEPTVEAVAGAIERVLRDDQVRTGIVAEARELVERRRDRNVELGRVEACYRDLAGA